MERFEVGDIIRNTNENDSKLLIVKEVIEIEDDEDIQRPIIGYDYFVNEVESNDKRPKRSIYIKIRNGDPNPYEKVTARGGKYRKSRRNRNSRRNKKSRRNRKNLK